MVNKEPALTRAYVIARTWAQPTYRALSIVARQRSFAHGAPSKPKKAAWKTRKPKKPAHSHIQIRDIASDVGGAQNSAGQGVRIVDVPHPMKPFTDGTPTPQPGTIFTYHDQATHQAFGCFSPKAAQRYAKRRNNQARRTLDTLIYPENGKFDRTHLIPIGYHGSESDQRLLIGWDSATNRGKFQRFENVQKKRTTPILWFTVVSRNSGGATWRYRIYDASSHKLLDKLNDTQTTRFVWR